MVETVIGIKRLFSSSDSVFFVVMIILDMVLVLERHLRKTYTPTLMLRGSVYVPVMGSLQKTVLYMGSLLEQSQQWTLHQDMKLEL